jgi:hypothetical protein
MTISLTRHPQVKLVAASLFCYIVELICGELYAVEYSEMCASFAYGHRSLYSTEFCQ